MSYIYEIKNKIGYILLPVIMSIAFIAVAAFMLNRTNGANMAMVSNQIEEVRAQFAARAGIAYARWYLSKNISENTYNFNFQGYSCTITTRQNGDYFDVTSISNGISGERITAKIYPSAPSKLYYIAPGEADRYCRGIKINNSSPIIRNCVITGNKFGDNGAGLYSNNSKIELINCSLRNNSAPGGYGGAIYSCSGSELYINDCIIESNYSSRGAGIYVLDSKLKANRCGIRRNKASYRAGGIEFYNCGYSSSITGCEIDSNISSDSYGGGIFCKGLTELTINNSVIKRNKISSSEGRGGGIYLEDTTAQINDTVIDSNFASSGGGIYYNGLSLEIKRSIIKNNKNNGIRTNRDSAVIKNSLFHANNSNYGGGIYNFYKMYVANSTFYYNTATTSGSAVYGGNDGIFVNCIFWGNTLSAIFDNYILVYNSDVQDGWNYTGEGTNINSPPLFIGPGYDFHLKPESPCRNTGTNNLTSYPFLPDNDIDRQSRPAEGQYDMGYDEYSADSSSEDPYVVFYRDWDHDKHSDGFIKIQAKTPRPGSQSRPFDYMTYDEIIGSGGSVKGDINDRDGDITTIADVPAVSKINVCKSGCAYSSIQAAINAAGDGNVILVGDGIYHESISISIPSKRILIKSLNGPEHTIIDGGNSTEQIVKFENMPNLSNGGIIYGIDGFTIGVPNMLYKSGLDWSNPVALTTIGHTPAAMAIDPKNRYIYWVDIDDEGKKTIKRISTSGSDLATVVCGDNCDALSLAVDPGNKLYWTKSDSTKIFCKNVDGTGNIETMIDLGTTSKPAGIAVDYEKGYLYWADNYGIRWAWNNCDYNISKINLYGTKTSSVVYTIDNPDDVYYKPQLLTLDPSLRKIFWYQESYDHYYKSGYYTGEWYKGDILASSIGNVSKIGYIGDWSFPLPFIKGIACYLLGETSKVYWADNGFSELGWSNTGDTLDYNYKDGFTDKTNPSAILIGPD